MSVPPKQPQPSVPSDNFRLRSLGLTWLGLIGSLLLFGIVCLILTSLNLDWRVITGVTMFLSAVPGIVLLVFWRQNRANTLLRLHTNPDDDDNIEATQGTPNFRANQPAWIRELPRLNFEPKEPDKEFELINPVELQKLLDKKIAEYIPDQQEQLKEPLKKRLKDDMDFLKIELLRLFVIRDHAAKVQQNRYRLYQICFLILAAVAAMFGAFQALALAANSRWMLLWSFVETVVALMSVFLASISGREPPLPTWLTNRRRAEQLRREYYRYLLRLAPYDEKKPDDVAEEDHNNKLKLLLSERAANINRGNFPSETGLGGGG